MPRLSKKQVNEIFYASVMNFADEWENGGNKKGIYINRYKPIGPEAANMSERELEKRIPGAYATMPEQMEKILNLLSFHYDNLTEENQDLYGLMVIHAFANPWTLLGELRKANPDYYEKVDKKAESNAQAYQSKIAAEAERKKKERERIARGEDSDPEAEPAPKAKTKKPKAKKPKKDLPVPKTTLVIDKRKPKPKAKEAPVPKTTLVIDKTKPKPPTPAPKPAPPKPAPTPAASKVCLGPSLTAKPVSFKGKKATYTRTAKRGQRTGMCAYGNDQAVEWGELRKCPPKTKRLYKKR